MQLFSFLQYFKFLAHLKQVLGWEERGKVLTFPQSSFSKPSKNPLEISFLRVFKFFFMPFEIEQT